MNRLFVVPDNYNKGKSARWLDTFQEKSVSLLQGGQGKIIVTTS